MTDQPTPVPATPAWLTRLLAERDAARFNADPANRARYSLDEYVTRVERGEHRTR